MTNSATNPARDAGGPSDALPVPPDDRSALTPDVPAEALAPAEPGDPDLGRLGQALGDRADVRTVILACLLVLAVFYTLRFARAFLLPIVLAVLLDFLLSPVVRGMKKAKIPVPVGAALVVFGLVAVVGIGSWQLAAPAAEYMRRGPESMARIREKLAPLRAPMEQVTEAAEQVEDATQMGGEPRTPQVEVAGPSLTKQIFGGTTAVLSAATIVVFLTFFLLAAGDLFLTKLVTVLPQFKDKKKAVMIARQTEEQISVFMVMSTLIGLGVGTVTGIACAVVGLPSPVLWGVVAWLLNYIPYIGAFFTMALLGLAGLLTFDSVSQALILPAFFFVVNLLEGNLITPMVMGRSLRMNTVAVFVGLMFWWYIWGIAGAIMAVPMLAAIKIMCDHIEPLAPVGEFLGD
jgi:predicted PurR-regulated permease PerM